MTINQTIDNFLNTTNLLDSARNFAQGLKFIVTQVEEERVTKKVLREIYSGANRASDSGRILNPALALFDKVMLTEVINNIADPDLKSNMSSLLNEMENWLNT
jgi:hypothetical protein